MTNAKRKPLVPITREFLRQFYQNYPLEPVPADIQSAHVCRVDELANLVTKPGSKVPEQVGIPTPTRIDDCFWRNRMICEEIALSLSKVSAALPQCPDVVEACTRCRTQLLSAEQSILAVQEHNTSSVTAQLQQFIPQDFRGALLARHRVASEARYKKQIEDLVKRGGTVRQKYDLYLQQQWERRQSLVQLGECSGMFKMALKLLAGIPQVLLDFAKEINAKLGPMEEQRIKYGPDLYGVTTLGLRLDVCLAGWAENATSPASRGAAAQLTEVVEPAVQFYCTHMLRVIQFIGDVFQHSPFFVNKDDLDLGSVTGGGGVECTQVVAECGTTASSCNSAATLSVITPAQSAAAGGAAAVMATSAVAATASKDEAAAAPAGGTATGTTEVAEAAIAETVATEAAVVATAVLMPAVVPVKEASGPTGPPQPPQQQAGADVAVARVLEVNSGPVVRAVSDPPPPNTPTVSAGLPPCGSDIKDSDPSCTDRRVGEEGATRPQTGAPMEVASLKPPSAAVVQQPAAPVAEGASPAVAAVPFTTRSTPLAAVPVTTRSTPPAAAPTPVGVASAPSPPAAVTPSAPVPPMVTSPPRSPPPPPQLQLHPEPYHRATPSPHRLAPGAAPSRAVGFQTASARASLTGSSCTSFVTAQEDQLWHHSDEGCALGSPRSSSDSAGGCGGGSVATLLTGCFRGSCGSRPQSVGSSAGQVQCAGSRANSHAHGVGLSRMHP